MATIGLKAMENPLEFGIVITREDGSIERFLEKPTWGQVFSDTINTGIYVLEPEIFDYIEPGQAGRLLLRRVSPPARRRHARCSATWPRATGRTSAPWTPTSRPTRTCSTPRWRWTSPASGWARGSGSGRAPRSIRRRPSTARRSSATTAGSRPAPTWPSTPCSAPTCGSAPDAFIERSVVHDNVYLGPGVRLRGRGRRPLQRSAPRAPGCEEGVVLGDECFVGEHAVINPGVKVYPFKTVEHGAIVNSSIVWESRGPATSSAASAWPVWPTSTSPRSWRYAWPWPTAPP